MAHPPKTCAAPDCANDFTPQRSTALYCSASCRARASTARKAAEEAERNPPPPPVLSVVREPEPIPEPPPAPPAPVETTVKPPQDTPPPAERPEVLPQAEHGLVTACRNELESAGKLETVLGQLSLQLARRLADSSAGNVSQLSKEFRALHEEALGTKKGADGIGSDAPATPAEPEEDPNDPVVRARRARQQALDG